MQEQLDSITRQTRLPDELVICDDSSSDNTIEIIRAFIPQAPFRVRLYVNEKNLGSTKNFERAIDLCFGDIIVLSDQDDVWCPEKLERIESTFFSRSDVGLVFSDGEVVDENLRPLGYTLWECFDFTKARKKMIHRGRPLEALLEHNVVTGATMAFRTYFRKLILPIPAKNGLLHDGWATLIIAAVSNLEFIDETLIKYRRHAKQQVGATRIGFFSSLGKVLNNDAKKAHLLVAQDYQEAYDRLATTENLEPKKVRLRLHQKIVHARARGSMPKRRLRRVPLVLRELFTLRYHHYSRGLYSAAKDLLFH